jgi:hypothetical protein
VWVKQAGVPKPKGVELVKARLAVRRWHRSYTGVLEHEIVVPVGPGGEPGARLRAPSPSMYSTRFGPDGSREDFRVLVGPRHSSFASVCLGTVANRGEPEALARDAPEKHRRQGITVRQGTFPDQIAGHDAWGHSFVIGTRVVTDWHFAHDGWCFVVGTYCTPEDNYWDAISRTREVMETWEWLD